MIRACATVMAAAAILVATSGPALACPVCFGASDAPMAVATNMGIIAMLVVVAGVLVGFASFFIYLMRRAKMVARQSVADDAAGYLDDGGTAQC